MNMRDEVYDYINCNETTGALLCTGPWGCGKSFLLKQIADELKEAQTAEVAVISLFGLDSVSAINKCVKEEYIGLHLGSMGDKIRKATKRLDRIAVDSLSIAGILNPGKRGFAAASQGISAVTSYDLSGYIQVRNTVGKDHLKFVIVFDDLERCGIANKLDLLGTINDYVENKKIKTIIIADEERIEETQRYYRDYKEKLISRTVRMSADYGDLIETIISTYPTARKDYLNFLAENQELLKQVFYESGSNNLRILKCIFADFERVYCAWLESCVASDNMKWALYTFSAESFRFRIGKKDENGTRTGQGSLNFGEDDSQYLDYGKNQSHFSTIDTWIEKGIWDKKLFIKELKEKYSLREESPLFRFLNYNLWDLNQHDLDEGLSHAVALAHAGELSYDSLIILIGKLHILKGFGIDLPCEISYARMEAGLDKRLEQIRNGTLEEISFHTCIDENSVDREALKLRQKLERFENRVASLKNRKNFLQYLSSDGSFSEYDASSKYLEEFDPELLELFWERYISADNTNKRYYARALLSFCYTAPEYSDAQNIKRSKAAFERLIKRLEGIQKDDKIALIVHKQFIKGIRASQLMAETNRGLLPPRR